MKTLAQIYDRFAGHDCIVGSDKGVMHSYLEVYAELFEPYRATAKRVLEIGLMGGHSLRAWEEYFTNAEVHGCDLNDQPHGGLADLRPMIAEGTHKIALLNAADAKQVEQHYAGMTFDVIVEDANHYLPDQLAMYANFKPHLATDGIYVIEDIADIDHDRAVFESLDSSKTVRIYDRRAIKRRFDDVLVVVGGR
jgi:spermidine synthase